MFVVFVVNKDTEWNFICIAQSKYKQAGTIKVIICPNRKQYIFIDTSPLYNCQVLYTEINGYLQ